MLAPKEREKLAKQFKGAAMGTGVLFLIAGLLALIDGAAVYLPKEEMASAAYMLIFAGILGIIGGVSIIAGANMLPKGKFEAGIPAGLSLGVVGYILVMVPFAIAAIKECICILLYVVLVLGLLGIILGFVLVLSPVMTLVRTFLFPTPPK
ncbi:MAG: hypothetical protein ACTSXJ_10750 [Candidatus Baldrarchaeia archaeon]